jgi:hypothetical protein
MVSPLESRIDECANRMTKVRPVTDYDIGLSVLYEPAQQETTESQANVIECVSSSYSCKREIF